MRGGFIPVFAEIIPYRLRRHNPKPARVYHGKGALRPTLGTKQHENNITMNDHILHDHNHDGIDRKGFLKCMAWAGTGVIWTLSSGVLTSRVLGQTPALDLPASPVGTLNFVQISD